MSDLEMLKQAIEMAMGKVSHLTKLSGSNIILGKLETGETFDLNPPFTTIKEQETELFFHISPNWYQAKFIGEELISSTSLKEH